MMPEIPLDSPLSFIGAFLLIVGIFLILAGLGIFKIKSVTVKTGSTTLHIGYAFSAIGFILVLIDGLIPIYTSPVLLGETQTAPSTNATNANNILPTISISQNSTPSSTLPPYCNKDGDNFFDDFTNPNSGWDVSSTSYAETSYANGEYQIKVLEGLKIVYSELKGCYHDFDLSIDVRNDSTSGGYSGVRFGIVGEAFYELDIYTADLVGVRLFWHPIRGDEPLTDLLGKDALKPGNVTNRIRIVLKDNLLSVFINDEFVGSATVESRIGKISLKGCTCTTTVAPASFYFDNVLVQPLD